MKPLITPEAMLKQSVHLHRCNVFNMLRETGKASLLLIPSRKYQTRINELLADQFAAAGYTVDVEEVKNGATTPYKRVTILVPVLTESEDLDALFSSEDTIPF